jgi:hypothetical protein
MMSVEEQIAGPGFVERAVYLMCWVLIVASLLGIGGALVDSADGWTPFRLVISSLLLTVGLFASWAMLRAARTKLVVRDHEVEIMNAFGSKVIARSDLRRFVAVPGGKWIVAETFAGERTPVSAISSGLIWTAKKRATRWNQRLGLELK